MMEALKEQLGGFAGSDAHSLIDDYGNPVENTAQAPTQAELEQQYTAPGEDALYEAGVTYHGDWKSHADGMARHVRMIARAMAVAGIPTKLESLGRSQLLDDEMHPDVQPVSWMAGLSLGRVSLSVKQSIFNSPDFVQQLLAPVGARFSGSADQARVMRSTIIYTSWERDRVHPAIVAALNEAAQVWVPCRQNMAAFKGSGVKNVRLVPYPFDPEAQTIAAPRGSEVVPTGKRFYSIGKWEPRKNHHGLIGAFLMAYTPKDKASLFIKTSPFGYEWAGYPAPQESLQFWLATAAVKENGWTSENLGKRVRIVEDRLTDEEIANIHKQNNIYVSASRGEAVNIPAFEAKLAGNAMVYVDWGGPQDFAEGSDVKVPYTLRPVHAGYRWPEKDALWAEAKVGDLKDALLQAAPKTKRRVPPDMHSFSLHEVGETVRMFLQSASPEVSKLWL